MLAIDTNVVVRYLVADDPVQAAKARKLIDGNEVFVCTTVMLETDWVLRSVYDFPARQCAKALADFCGLASITLEDPTSVAKALAWVAEGIDFADGLHLAKAESCDAFISFDKEFASAANGLDGLKVRAP